METGSESARPIMCHAYREGRVEVAEREVIGEQPLRLIVNGEAAATLMRTPGAETELAIGFLLTDGIVGSFDEIGAISYCREGLLGEAGEVIVRLSEGSKPRRRGYRDIFTSCSLCDDAWIEDFAEGLPRFDKPEGRLRPADIFSLRNTMVCAQDAFRRTGGAHAGALAELPLAQNVGEAVVREDIGRHNALDKAVGAAAARGLRLEHCLLVLSSRLSFEMIAKAARAGVSDLAGVSAPSALGVELARRLGMFLAGFVRGESMMVYSGVEALRTDQAASQ